MLAMISLAYYVRGFQELQFNQYLSMDSSVVADLNRHQAAAQMKFAKAQAQAEKKRDAEAAEKRRLQQLAIKIATGTATEEEEKGDGRTEADIHSAAVAGDLDDPANPSESDEEQQNAILSGLDVSRLATTIYFHKKMSVPKAAFAYLRAICTLVGAKSTQTPCNRCDAMRCDATGQSELELIHLACVCAVMLGRFRCDHRFG